MKTRQSFVTNSSSSSYLITWNKSTEELESVINKVTALYNEAHNLSYKVPELYQIDHSGYKMYSEDCPFPLMTCLSEFVRIKQV